MNDGIPPKLTPPAEVRQAPERELTLAELAFDVDDLRHQLGGLADLRRQTAYLHASQGRIAGTQARQGELLELVNQKLDLLLKERGLEVPKQNAQATVPA